MRRAQLWWSSGLFLLASSAGLADTLTLKSGRVMEGTYLGGTARQVRMEIGDRIESFEVESISGLQFRQGSDSEGVSSVRGSSSSDDAPPRLRRSDGSRLESGPRDDGNTRTSDSPAEIPAGTSVVVRMIDSVDSNTARLGETFRASVDEPVFVNGNTVIPRGADVVAKLVEDQKSGKIEGRTVLALALVSVIVNGRMVDLTTQDVATSSSSRGARSAKVVGGTAALGAILGGIVGGGRGAAIGAGSGAAVGTGAQVMTNGQRVRIPSETRLTFTLTYPVRV